MSYEPIENYGIIGNLNTIALSGLNGSIDFLCFPNFDSPTVFANLLDCNKGGQFLLRPVLENSKTKQMYMPDTNVLLTRFLSDEGVGEITDFMPVEEKDETHYLIRRITTIRGKIKYKMICSPRLNYGLTKHKVEKNGYNQLTFTADDHTITFRLTATVKLSISGDDGIAEFILNANEQADFIFEQLNENSKDPDNINSFVTDQLYSTINYWKHWIAQSGYSGSWQEYVNRSALVLKLMTSEKYGSLVASPTFSLPEYIGGSRNWDYRYTWIRDSSFTIYTLINLGYRKEAECFMKWVAKKCEDIKHPGYLGLMYRINGEKVYDEIELQHFEGYMKSSPVRIGNNAYKQIQLDIYGELLDSVFLFNKYVEPISYGFWQSLAEHINWLAENWHLKDEGIWEVRGGKRHFLYSRLMCWVAFDRIVKLGQARSFPVPNRWIDERDKIFNSIFKDFWNDDLKAFVQYKGADTVDAASLLMPLMRFISPKDPMWLSTLKQIEETLVSDSLVFRYRPMEAASDGLKTGEGTFSMCTFWYIECLAKAGELRRARLYFEKMLGYANHLGLFSEQLGFRGEHLGNYPQAFTHLGLISAVLSLNTALDDQRNKEITDGT